jgi:2-keto-4-pentenoate hydratase
VNGEVRTAAAAPKEFSQPIRAAARLLAAMGERLQAGDRLITGSVVQVRLEPGDEVVADFGPLGQVGLLIDA